MPVVRLSLMLVAGLAVLVPSAAFAQKAGPGDPLKYPALSMKGLPLVFSDNFESGAAERWEPTDATAWSVLNQGGNHVLNLNKKRSDFEPPVRSPYNRNLVKDVTVSDFVLDINLQSTHEDYGHRDLCMFFGYQDDAHLYYVHLGKKADPHANQIFIVNDADRKMISLESTPGTDWDDNWHHARIVRDTATGSIEVFFDNMDKPVMKAKDETFTWGRVGVGSFDDTGSFDNIMLFGSVVEK
ncbi:MAG: hypothetical protein KDA65_04775 [Planctomycetaceae bacterium]|nr:hypothetical protein [Planctomycetaceae bacterium]